MCDLFECHGTSFSCYVCVCCCCLSLWVEILMLTSVLFLNFFKFFLFI